MTDSTLVSRLLDLWSDPWPPDTGLSSEGHAGDALVSTVESLQYSFPQTDWNNNQAFEERHTINLTEVSTKPNFSRTTASELLLCLAEVLLEANETKQGLDYLYLRIEIFRKGDLHNPERLGAINRYLAELLQERKYSDVKKGIKDYLEPAENSL